MPESRPIAVSVVAAQLCAKVPGGTGRYTIELLKALGDCRQPSDTLCAWLARGCRPTLDRTVLTAVLPAPPVVLARLWERNLPPRLAARGVVHAPTLLVPPRQADTALVVTVHDVVPWTHPETLTKRGVTFHRRMGTRVAREADIIVTPTQAVAEEVRQRLNPLCPVLAVPPGTTSTAAPLDSGERRKALRIRRPYVLFVGTAEPRKGLDALVAAMARPALADFDLVVVGPSGWGNVDVSQLARAAGVDDRVISTGPVSDVDLAACYAGASVLAVPSRAEGFGLPVLEAMFHGVPVVSSMDPALREVGANAAMAVDIGDIDALAVTCAQAAEEGEARRSMVERGRRRASHFSWRRTGEAMWDVYLRALDQRASAA